MRMNPYDYIAGWYTKERYIQVYSNCVEVIRGQPFWEEEGDTVLPPEKVKKLRGRPKKLRRREGWEGRVTKGSTSRLSRIGRVMHCSICRETGHNRDKCPQKPEDEEPKEKKKRGRKRKVTDEEEVEVQNMANEAATGEAELMENALRATEIEISQPKQTTTSNTRRSQRILQKKVDGSVNESEDNNVLTRSKATSKFMPTPCLLNINGTGCTHLASTPPNPVIGSQSSTSTMTTRLRRCTTTNKFFKVPRQKQ